MLGWSDKSMSFIRQIAIANASEGGGVVVVLSDRDKVEMELELLSQLPPDLLHKTRVVFRTGNPMLNSDLLRVSASAARSIVVMAQNGDPDQSDAFALRVVLALKGMVRGLNGPVVVEMRDIDNESLVSLIGGSSVHTIVSHDIVGRMVVMAGRQPGLSLVMECLVGFEDVAFYFKCFPTLAGVPFSELFLHLETAIVIGLKPATGSIVLKPPPDRILLADDEVIVLAEDNDTFSPVAVPKLCPRVGQPPQVPPQKPKPETILLCGWRRDVRDMITLIDKISAKGASDMRGGARDASRTFV